MKVYLIERKPEDYTYCDNYATVVIAEDSLHAEKYARQNVYGWKKAKLKKPQEIKLDKKEIILTANLGS